MKKSQFSNFHSTILFLSRVTISQHNKLCQDYYTTLITGNIVAEFRDYQWKHIADLRQPRSRHSSIAFGSQTIIIGGEHEFSLDDNDFSDGEDISTEVWDCETGISRTIEPTLPVSARAYTGSAIGISLYFVDNNFCRSSDSTYDPWGSNSWG